MNKLRFAWIVSVVAVFGSLYFSEIRHFIPCEYCWYQRILMYPIPVLLGVAMIRGDRQIPYYVLPLSILGICMSTFHYLKQKLPMLSEIGSCSSGVPCSGQYINWLGFITIPFLALTAFVLITTTMVLHLKEQKKAA